MSVPIPGRNAAAMFYAGFSGVSSMSMKKTLVSALLAAGIIGAIAMPLPSFAAVIIQLDAAPPAARYEAVPVQQPGYVWQPGYWNYENNNHVWVNGVSVREREGYTYTPHHWVQRDGKWGLEEGHWDRR
jgi:hypothetical protein